MANLITASLRYRLGTYGLAVLLLSGPAVLAGPLPGDEGKEQEKEKKTETAQKSEKDEKQTAKKKPPRVITNADLEKYARRSTGKQAAVQPARPGAAGLPAEEAGALDEPPVPQAPRTSLPPEERLDEATVPELEDRERELATLLAYLDAKVAWLRNPFLPRPTPPPGELLLDPEISAAQDYELTRSRAFVVRGRLQKVRVLIQQGGAQP